MGAMMKKRSAGIFTAKNIAYFAVLLALVVVMQTVGGAIRFGALEMSFVLIPVVLGAILIGAWAGALLGFAFGLITLIYGITGASSFTQILFVDHPVITALTCLVKGTAAGFVPGLVYRLIAKKSAFAASVVAAALAPVCNTGIFILGALLMSGTIQANFVSEGSSVLYFLVIGCAGVNFLLELAANLVLSPAIYRIVRVTEKAVMHKHSKAEQASREETDRSGEGDV